ncbi:DEAD/DEAH box helicase [Georgenia sp. TF02-10]|uniref:DEAD/DEAH box helicase n=1 Tax=Georgenia sp. TF02-10 TaxID=2917725 RepID=UPI001FA743C9|nr:DEAD/DEAH box helicase [Georgenia sp. TF02-10]UNX55248.1 DEAD/DEAH box helicase [Georgenia sp. TF02-10]
MPGPDLLALLRRLGADDGRLVHVEQLPARPGTTAPWPAWADPDVVAGYRRTGVPHPWVHQVAAAEAAWAGRHTVIATGTGSGKSLAAWLPALSAVREAGRTGGAAQAAGAAADGAGPRGRGAAGDGGTARAAGRAGAVGVAARGRPAGTRSPTTLYLAPTKALAADQLAGLERLLAAAGLADEVRVSACDGDTPLTERDWARAHADVVLSNPDFLHYSLLPGHRRWHRLLRGLRYVVVDECHAYRGVLGAHVAAVLRRLLRLAEHYGARPTVVCASATTAEPALTAARLVGVAPEDVVAVTEDTAPAGRRAVALWQPALAEGAAAAWPGQGVDVLTGPAAAGTAETGTEETEGPRRSAGTEAAELLADLVRAGARTLVFVRSRTGAEVIAEQARTRLRPVDPDLAARVATYRGGYLPEERRALERALRSGELLALATTNALELGVDVAGLDAVVIAGWPGTRVSLWQQAGRAGRAGAEGVAVLVASENPLDAYLVHHPEAIFGAGVEATTFDPANPYVLAPHLCAAAAELALTEPDLARFGLADADLLAALVDRGLLRRRPTGWFWNIARPERPQDLTGLRGGDAAPVAVVEAGTGAVLGTVDGDRADATVHPGAVYVHQGSTFVVEELTDDVALVHPAADLGYRTKARGSSSVRILAERDAAVWPAGGGSAAGGPVPAGAPRAGVAAESPGGAGGAGGEVAAGAPAQGPERTPADVPGGVPTEVSGDVPDEAPDGVRWSFGDVEVTSQVTGYDRRRLPGLDIIGSYPLDMPERVLETRAVWWTVSEAACSAAGLTADRLPGSLHAAEHASIGLLPLLATCDRWDIGGLSTARHPQTGQPTVFVHDGYPGGAGFAERGYRAAAAWLRATLDAITSCGCLDGCPSCVQSPKCGNANSPLDKAGAVTLLRLLLRHAPA